MTGWSAAWLRVTPRSMSWKPALPSVTDSVSTRTVKPSSSVIVAVAVGRSITTSDESSVTMNVSWGSGAVSPIARTWICRWLSPGATERVPVFDV